MCIRDRKRTVDQQLIDLQQQTLAGVQQLVEVQQQLLEVKKAKLELQKELVVMKRVEMAKKWDCAGR